MSFTDTKWKFRVFVRATDSFLDKYTASNLAKSYGNVAEKFKLTGKLTKVASDNATSTDEAFQVFCNSCAVLCFH